LGRFLGLDPDAGLGDREGDPEGDPLGDPLGDPEGDPLGDDPLVVGFDAPKAALDGLTSVVPR
jgi:hypothetical protein